MDTSDSFFLVLNTVFTIVSLIMIAKHEAGSPMWSMWLFCLIINAIAVALRLPLLF